MTARTTKTTAGRQVASRGRRVEADGARGWNEYAEFYDWENARTMGTRDVAFWRELARQSNGPILELGSGTGRVTAPLSRAGVTVVGVDRSLHMLERARRRLRRLRSRSRTSLVRADITQLPFAAHTFSTVIAPYGVLQSLLSDALLSRTLNAVADVLEPGGRVGLELVPDVARWQETGRRVSLIGLNGPNGKPVTLLESVRQDRPRRITTFDHEFVEGTGKGRRSVRFTVQFRTLRVPAMRRRLERVGLTVDGAYGGYRGEPWSEDADTWILIATKPR